MQFTKERKVFSINCAEPTRYPIGKITNIDLYFIHTQKFEMDHRFECESYNYQVPRIKHWVISSPPYGRQRFLSTQKALAKRKIAIN